MKNSLLVLAVIAFVGILAGDALAQGAPVADDETLIEDIVAWVNDDVVLLSDLDTQEQGAIQALMSDSSIPPQRIAEEVKKIKEQTLVSMIWNRLLVQEAERLFNLEALKEDILQRFMKSRDIPNLAELDSLLAKAGLEREELTEKLLDQAAPEIVLRQSVNDTLGVSEAEARKYYEDHQDEFTTKGHVVFREIVLLDAKGGDTRRAEAEKIVAQAREGSDFVALVKNFSEAPSQAIDGKIGPVSAGDLVTVIAEAAVSVPVGSISDAIRTDKGWHIIKVEERVDDSVLPFEQVRVKCEDGCRGEKYGPAFEAFVKKLWEASTIEVRSDYMDRLTSPWSESVIVR